MQNSQKFKVKLKPGVSSLCAHYAYVTSRQPLPTWFTDVKDYLKLPPIFGEELIIQVCLTLQKRLLCPCIQKTTNIVSFKHTHARHLLVMNCWTSCHQSWSCGLTLQVPRFWGLQALHKQLFCQKCNRGTAGVSACSASRQTRFVLIKKSVTNWPFPIMPRATTVWLRTVYGGSNFPHNSRS